MVAYDILVNWTTKHRWAIGLFLFVTANTFLPILLGITLLNPEGMTSLWLLWVSMSSFAILIGAAFDDR